MNMGDKLIEKCKQYMDMFIRNERELNNIRDYIINNPLSWELDKENPKD